MVLGGKALDVFEIHPEILKAVDSDDDDDDDGCVLLSCSSSAVCT